MSQQQGPFTIKTLSTAEINRVLRLMQVGQSSGVTAATPASIQTGVVSGDNSQSAAVPSAIYVLKTDLAATGSAALGAGMVGYKQFGAGAVGTTLYAKTRQVFNVKDFGASATASKAANAAAMLAAIAAVNTLGGGTVVVDRDINYGYKRVITDGVGTWDGQPNVWPDFSACTQDVEVWDSSIGNTYGPNFSSGAIEVTITVIGSNVIFTRSTGSWVTDGVAVGYRIVFSGFSNDTNNGSKTVIAVTATTMTSTLVAEVAEGPTSGITAAHDGSQFRRWQFTHNATLGNTDGDTQWVRGNWAPALMISNDSRVASPSVNSWDNRRCGIFLQNDGVVTWGVGQGTITGIGYTSDELSTFTIKANGLSGQMPPTYAGAITSVFTLSKKTGGFAFNSGVADTYAGYFGARAGIAPSFVFDGETSIDPSTPFAAGTGHVDDGSGGGSPPAGTILTVTAINSHATTTFAAAQTAIMQGLGEGVTIGSQLTGTPGGIGTYQLSGMGAPLALGSRTVVAGTTVIPGEPTILLLNGYSTAAAPFSKLILKNLNVAGQTYPGWGIRVDGEFHGMVKSFFNVSDTTHQLVISSLTNSGAPGSANIYVTGDRTTVSTSGAAVGGTFDQLKIFNSGNNKSINVKFRDDNTTIEITTNGTGAQIVWADPTQSTSTVTGSQIFKGGVAIQKDLFGVNATFSGTITAGAVAAGASSFTGLVTITVSGSNNQLRLVRTTSSAGTVNVFANAAGTGSTDTFNVTDSGNATIFQATLTGATITGALTAGITTAPSFATSGIGGLGFFDYNAQSSAPGTPASNHARVFVDATGRFSWKRSDGFVRTFASTLTGDHVWTWPDADGTVITSGNLTGIVATGTVASGTWNGTKIGLAYGGTNLDMTATGGSNQFMKQTSLGGAITVAGVVSADLTTALTTPPAIGGTTAAAGTFLGGASFNLQDPTDPTKQMRFTLSSIATGTTRSLTIPNANFTVAGVNLSQNWTGTQTFTTGIFCNSATAGIGYTAGAGGTVAQATNKSTGVTLNKSCGAITMNNAALASDTVVSFTLTDSAIGATDVLILNHISAGTAGAYALNAQCAAGSASINVYNHTAGSLSEAIVIQFAVIKGVSA